jgi:ABC-type nitrate/sulfonate/bicarbonate transport system substrate-binding protein
MNNDFMKRIFSPVFTLSLLLLATLSTSCSRSTSSPQTKSIRFAQLPICYSAVAFVAQEEGYFPTNELHFTSFSVPAGPDVVTSLKTQSQDGADVGDIAVTPVVSMIGSGGEPVVLATMLTSDEQTKLMAFSNSGITEDPKTLKGKRIGVVKNTNGDVYLWRLLKKGNLSASDVQLVVGRPAELNRYLIHGDIDAAVLWDPFVVQAQREYKVLLTEKKTQDRGDLRTIIDPTIYTLAFNIVTTRAKLQRNREALASTIKGLIMASDYIEKNPDKAETILEKWLNLEPGDLSNFMKTTHFRVYIDVPQMKGWMTGELEWLNATQPGSTIPADLSPYIDASILESVDKSRVNE